MKTILLVEDEALIAMAASKAVEKFGYAVIVATSGEHAVATATAGTAIDLILMDIDLGKGIDGPQAAQRILEKVAVPIVFLSSHSEREMVDRVRGITRYGYVIKNSGDFVLRSSIEMALELFDANRRLHAELAERRHAETALAESERRLQSIFRVAPTGIGVVRDRIILEVNPRLCQMTGYNSEELVGMRARLLYPTEKDYVFVGSEKYRQIPEKGTGELETRWRRKDGRIIDVLLASTPMDAGNLSQGVTFTALDITERNLVAKALRENEEYLSTTIQSIGDGVIVTDTTGAVTRLNKTAERLTGWTSGEALGKPLSEVFRIEDADTGQAVASPVETVLVRGTVVGLANHTVLVGKMGSRYQIADSAAPIRDESGAVKGVILVFSDVTEKYRAEEIIRVSERRMKSIVESSPMGMHMYELAPDGRLVFVGANPAADRILGTDNSAFLGMTIEEAFPPLAGTEVPLRYKQVAGSGGTWKTEQVEYDDDKIQGAFEVIAFQTAQNAMTAMFFDITARKRADEALRGKTEELEEYFLTALDLYCIADLEGHFLKLNQQWEKTLGYPMEDLQGKAFLDFVHPEDLEATQQAIGRLEKREEVLNFVNRYRCKDGSYKWIEWRSGMRGDRIYAAARDITAHENAEEKIRSLLAEKELILKEVHHRIKNNMNTMIGLLSLQAGIVADLPTSAALQDAMGRLQSMGVLYERLYQSENISELSVRDYLPTLAEEIVSMFPNAGKAAIAGNVEDFSLGAKQLSILGIIVNELITNSMKYAFAGRDNGVITLCASAIGGHARFLVADDGVGIPESIDFAGSHSFGLQLVQLLTEQLHGTIRMERGEGTRFILEFDTEGA